MVDCFAEVGWMGVVTEFGGGWDCVVVVVGLLVEVSASE